MDQVQDRIDSELEGPQSTHSVATAQSRPGWLSWTAAVGIVLLVVARLPTENLPVWTPKAAVALVLTGLAIPQFVVLLRYPGPIRRTAIAAGVFLAAVALAAALSPLTGVAFLGQYGASTGVGWIFYLCLVACWSLGATLDDAGPQLVHNAIVVACVLDALASVLALLSQHTSALSDFLTHIPGLLLDGGQALGLMDNPVYSGALLAGGAALLATTTYFQPRTRYELLVVVGAGLELSGSRFGMLVVALVVITVGAVKGFQVFWRVGASAAVGVAAGYGLNRLLGGANVGSRFSNASSGSTYGGRLGEWSAALHATLHHPIVGLGPAQSMSGASHFWSATFAIDSTPFLDVHNLFIEIVVTTGILGFGCFLVWLVPVIRHAQGPLMICGLSMLAIELVEPFYVGVTPIAFLALGAAIKRPNRSPANTDSELGLEANDQRETTANAETSVAVPSADSPVSTVAELNEPPKDPITFGLRVATTGIAVVMACVLLIGDAYYHQGLTGNTNQLANLKTAARLLPPWPQIATDISSVSSNPQVLGEGGTKTAANQLSLEWAQRAVDRNPTNFELLTALANAQVAVGNLSGARTSYHSALSYFQYYKPALSGLASLDLQEGNAEAALALFKQALNVAGTQADEYQVQCLTHVIPRHLTTSQLLMVCPVNPPLLQLLGAAPPGWVATPSVRTRTNDVGPSFP